MKTKIKIPVLLAILSILFFACQKELSFEQGNSNASVGNLQADAGGGCMGVVVSGTFYKDSTLGVNHFTNVNVTVDTAGSYKISTDTIQGYSFSASGNFTTTGSQVVKLKGIGKPLSVGTHIFTVNYNGTICEFSVTVIAGSGGTGVFTISCTGALVNGTYSVGTAMTSGNTVTLNATVTTIGTWSISTAPAVSGVIFSGSGTFSNTGAQTITLIATGTPTTGGTANFPVSAGGSTCNFQVNFSTGTDYFPRTVNSNWSYEFDDTPSDSVLVKVIPQTLTASGNSYNIFMWTDNAANGFDTSGYYRRSGSDYYEWIDIGSYIGFDNPLWIEYNFLKDNLTAGGIWNTTSFTGTITPMGGTATNVTARFLFTILQQNTSVTVKGIAYTNTIVVRQDLQTLIGATWTTVTAAGHLRNYFSRDKGLIKQDYYSATGAVDLKMEVRRLVVF